MNSNSHQPQTPLQSAAGHGLNNISHQLGSIGSWADAVDSEVAVGRMGHGSTPLTTGGALHHPGGPTPLAQAAVTQPPSSLAAYKRSESIKDGVKTVVDYVDDPERGRCRVTTQYKVVTKSVPKCVAERREWRKFGTSARDGAGPQIYTTYVAEEVWMQFLRTRQGELIDQQGLQPQQQQAGGRGETEGKAGQHCRFCKSDDHWSVNCPYREIYEHAYSDEQQVAGAEIAGVGGGRAGLGTPSSGAGGATVPFPPNLRQPPPGLGGAAGGGGAPAGPGQPGRYVNPFARGDRQLPAAGAGGMGERRTDDFTCRVTNLPEDSETLDEDLRGMFSSVGRIERFYLARDKQTNKPKGFAFVTFTNRQDAERAIERFNGWKMEHLILKVEWTKPN